MPNPDRMFFRPNKPPTRRQIASKVAASVAVINAQSQAYDALYEDLQKLRETVALEYVSRDWTFGRRLKWLILGR